MDIDYFKKSNTGNIITIGVNDIQKIRRDFYQGIVQFFSNLMMVLMILIKLFFINWKLTLITLVVLPLLAIVVRVMGNKMRKISRKLRKNLAELSSNYHETLTGMEVVKSFAKEDYELDNFKNNTKRYKKNFLRLIRLQTIFSPINDVIAYLVVMLLVGVGGIFIIRGMWEAKPLTEYLLLLGIMGRPLLKIPKYISEYKIVSASIDRVYDVVSTKPKIAEIENPVLKRISGKLEFRNVNFSYDQENDVLKHVSFIIEKGDILAFVGPSGAGKTTIANLIPRFYDCNSGKVLIDDIDIRNYSLSSLRSQIGFVSQNVILFNTSIYENIRYSMREAKAEEIIEAAKQAYAYDFIKELPQQFDTIVGEKGVRLSGGQKQRISIARTILINPHILILDEATSALDSESEYYIKLAINNLMEGRTSVLIAHRLSTISHATKILVIDKGEIIDNGSHDELLNRCDLYKRVYELQYFR
jgi:subfamily B ATP-binding cassette protein MsbA